MATRAPEQPNGLVPLRPSFKTLQVTLINFAPFMPRFLDALRHFDTGDTSAIWTLLKNELEADLALHEDGIHATWKPHDIEHSFLLSDCGEGGRYLVYSAKMFETRSATLSLQLASLLNRRQYGIAFVSIPVDDQSVLYAYSYCRLDEDYWTAFVLHVMSLKRTMCLVELISRQSWARDLLGVGVGSPPPLEKGTDQPVSMLLTGLLDPLDPTFATGLWISDAEAREFHESMKRLLPYLPDEIDRSYTFPSSNADMDISSDVRLESTYLHGSLSNLSPVRDYEIEVKIRQVRHPELGWGLQETQRFAFFTTGTPSSSIGGDIGDPDACVIANILNLRAHKQVLSNSSHKLGPVACGSWVAKHDQLYFGAFFPSTVLKDLADECVGAFGFALSLAVSPWTSVRRAESFMTYLRDEALETQREPDRACDHWSGCGETTLLWPAVIPATPTDENRSRYGADFSSPVSTSIASWGIFHGGPELYTLDLIEDPATRTFSLVRRHRSPDRSGSFRVFGPEVAPTHQHIVDAVSNYLTSMRLPRIDWCQIQDPIYDEAVRTGLRGYAHHHPSPSSVEQIFSDVVQAPTPWDLYLGDSFENVFDSGKSIEAGFEWAVTLPRVVDAAIARLENVFRHARLRESGATELELIHFQVWSEYWVHMRMGAIEVLSPIEDFLRNTFHADEDTIKAVLEFGREE